MKFKTTPWLFALIFSVCALPAAGQPQPPASQPAGDDRAYNGEAYRRVEKPGQIVSVLNNGLTVLVRRTSTPVVSVQSVTRTGSIYEGQWLGGGLSHLLEHLVAGPSCQRRTEKESRDLLQKIGNNSNAYTDYEQTVFFVNTTPDHLEEAVDLVTGWVFGAKILEDEYRREYEVVQRELEKYKGEADSVFDDLSMYNRYQLSPARCPVVGYQAVIQSLSRDEIYAYYKMTYVPQNMVIAVTGNVDPEMALRLVRKYVADVKPGRVPSKAITPEPPVLVPRSVAAVFAGMGQARVELGFPTVKGTHADSDALDLLAAILGRGESSIVIEELRDKQQLVSGASATHNTLLAVEGTFAIRMDLAPGKIKQATDAALALVGRLKTDLIDAERINRTKAMIKAQEAMSLQTAEGIATTMFNSYLALGTPEPVYAERIGKITAEQLRDAARKYLDTSKLLTTSLLPAEVFDGVPPESQPPLPKAVDLLRQGAPATQPKNPFVAESSEPKVIQEQLDNGTVLIIKPIPSSAIVSIEMMSFGGLTAEDAKTNGLGNLTMRLLPRGTRTRGAADIAGFFDSIGGSFDSGCSYNSWFWNAHCLKEDLAKTMEVVGDVACNPTFPDAEVDNMKQRVIADIESMGRDWYATGERFALKSYFGPLNSPYQFMFAGTTAGVAALTAPQVRDWYAQHIATGRRVLTIFGDVDSSQVRQLAQKYLGALPKAAPPASVNVPPAPQVAASAAAPAINIQRVEIQKTQNPQCAIFIAFKTDDIAVDAEVEPLLVARTLTNGFGYPTGYIFETLRGLGLIYDANAKVIWGRDEKLPGSILFYAVCDPKNADTVINHILLNIARLQGTEKDIDGEWFGRAKALLITSVAMDRETPAAQALEAGTDRLYGLPEGYRAGFADRVRAVQLSQIQSLARRRLSDCVVTISTPEADLVKTTKAGVRTYTSFPAVDLAPKGVAHDSPAAKP